MLLVYLQHLFGYDVFFNFQNKLNYVAYIEATYSFRPVFFVVFFSLFVCLFVLITLIILCLLFFMNLQHHLMSFGTHSCWCNMSAEINVPKTKQT